MNRRRFLALFGTTPVVAGCVRAPRIGPGVEAEASDSDASGGGAGDSDSTDAYGDENIDRYRHELGDWFELSDEELGLRVDGTERSDASDFGETGEDVYVVKLRMENSGDDRAAVETEQFWLEKLGRDASPDTAIAEQLDSGATDEVVGLEPDDSRRLQLAFRVPDELEPAYLWIGLHYVCLVP